MAQKVNTAQLITQTTHYIVRDLQTLIDIIHLDHAYAKPWSAHPEASKARPLKRLFLPKPDSEVTHPKHAKKQKENDVINVVTVDPTVSSSTVMFDTAKAKAAMAECEKHVSAVSSKKTPDTWEEQISRVNWTPNQSSVFDKVTKVMSGLRLARLAYESSTNEPVLRRIATDKATKRMRQILCSVEWDAKLTSWLHTTLTDGLSIPLLACYLDVLQTLRAKVPTLVDRMTASPVSQRRGPASACSPEALSILLKRPWDPAHGLVTQHKQRKLPGSPLLLIVPSGPTTNTGSGISSKRARFWHNQLSVLGKVVPVTMHTSNGGSGVSINHCLDHIIGAVRTKVIELQSHFPNRPVILIGWSVGALVSCQVALMQSVCAVVCLGFPITGLDGVRGDVEDPILELKTPTLFVVGSHSSLSSQEDMEEIREKMKADTSLLVVGGADEQLRLTRAKKKQEGFTQSMIDRLIMDEIGDFLGNVLTSMNSVQQRHDFSDADEMETRKKKRKRCVSRDLSAELGASSKKTASQKSAISTEAGKSTVLKIPVGNTLGAISGMRAHSEPSPAKKPRTSKSKASKTPVQVSSSQTAVRGSIPSQISGQSSAFHGVHSMSTSIARQIPLSGSSSVVAGGEQAFMSLATKGVSFDASKVTQSFVMSRSGSPAVLAPAGVGGHAQFIIRPQSQRTTVSGGSGGSVGSGVPASGSMSLSQSPNSPFKSVVSMKRLPPGTQVTTVPMRVLSSVGMPHTVTASLPASAVQRMVTHAGTPQGGVMRTTIAPRAVSLAPSTPSVTQVSAKANVTQVPATSHATKASVMQVPVTSLAVKANVMQVPPTSFGTKANVMQVPATSLAMKANTMQVPVTSLATKANVTHVPATSLAMKSNVMQVPVTSLTPKANVTQVSASSLARKANLAHAPPASFGTKTNVKQVPVSSLPTKANIALVPSSSLATKANVMQVPVTSLPTKANVTQIPTSLPTKANVMQVSATSLPTKANVMQVPATSLPTKANLMQVPATSLPTKANVMQVPVTSRAPVTTGGRAAPRRVPVSTQPSSIVLQLSAGAGAEPARAQVKATPHAGRTLPPQASSATTPVSYISSTQPRAMTLTKSVAQTSSSQGGARPTDGTGQFRIVPGAAVSGANSTYRVIVTSSQPTLAAVKPVTTHVAKTQPAAAVRSSTGAVPQPGTPTAAAATSSVGTNLVSGQRAVSAPLVMTSSALSRAVRTGAGSSSGAVTSGSTGGAVKAPVSAALGVSVAAALSPSNSGVSVPSVPSVRSLPSVSSVPSVSIVSGVPSVRSLPSVSSVSSVPSARSVPSEPIVSSLPSVSNQVTPRPNTSAAATSASAPTIAKGAVTSSIPKTGK